MKVRLFILGLAVLCLATAPAAATPGGPPGAALQKVLDDITTSPVAGTSSINVATDYIPDDATPDAYGDSFWDITATGGSVSTLIIELASFKEHNTFGVYDPFTSNKVEVFGGSASEGVQATLSITSAGDVYLNHVDTGVDFTDAGLFGYYLDSSFYAGGGTWYSATGKNSDGYDHMYAYRGNNVDIVEIAPWGAGTWTDDEYILAFEDLDGAIYSDWDYTDMVVMVESVEPVPVPAAALLAMLGLSAAGIKLRRFA